MKGIFMFKLYAICQIYTRTIGRSYGRSFSSVHVLSRVQTNVEILHQLGQYYSSLYLLTFLMREKKLNKNFFKQQKQPKFTLAKFCPMQLRCPSENGMYVYGLILIKFQINCTCFDRNKLNQHQNQYIYMFCFPNSESFMNLSGMNSSGFGKYFSLR